MPFKLIPKERENFLREKKDRFKIIAEVLPGMPIEYRPDNWTMGVTVVVVDKETQEIKGYWSDGYMGGYWQGMDGTHAISPYLYKRPKAAFKRMEKVADDFGLFGCANALDFDEVIATDKIEGRLAIWWAGDHRPLSKYVKTTKGRFPGSPTK